MQVGYTFSFKSTNTGLGLFRWDSPDDNADLVSYATRFGVTATVDDTLTPPVFNWEDSSVAGPISGSIDLTEGIYLRVGPPVGGVSPAVIPAGSWFSDSFGRPFDLNDLVSGA